MEKFENRNEETTSKLNASDERGSKSGKPFYKKWWFWVVAVVIVICIASTGKDNTDTNGTTASEQVTQSASEQPKEESSSEPINQEASSKPENKDSATSVPAEYKSALKKAKLYSDTMHMSKKGLYEQLTSEYGEKFSAEAAQYAIDNVNADWKANALAKAESYQETMSMSPEAIRDQLTSEYGEQFTSEEADYAIANLSK